MGVFFIDTPMSGQAIAAAFLFIAAIDIATASRHQSGLGR
jgi:hypothetical protein